MAERARSVAEASGADVIRIWTYNFLGVALVGVGRVEEGFESLRRSYREAMQHELRWIAGTALHNNCALMKWVGEPRALQTLEWEPMLSARNVGIWSTTSPVPVEDGSMYC